jgi:hypothetical protein
MRISLFAIALWGLFCASLCAQEYPAAEVYGGYQLLYSEGMSLNGFTTAVEGNVSNYFGIVGEFGLGMKTVSQYGIDVSLKEASFMGGPRFSYRADKARVFVHALFGGTRISGGSSVANVNVGVSTTGFGMALGGGLDFAAGKSISIRPAQVDLIRIHQSVANVSGWENQLRYSAGIVFKLGSRGTK